MAIAVVALAAAVLLFSGTIIRIDLPLYSPLGPLVLEAGDGVAGAYLLLVGLVGAAAVLAAPRDGLDRTGRALVTTFLAGLVLVPLAGDVFTLLLAWELMSAPPGILLVLDARPEPRRAGLVYLAYSQVSALSLAVGLFLWSAGTDGSLDALLATTPRNEALLLIVLAAAIKAGLMPFHSWLPEAHPAAPGHVSALMSGVMVALPSYVLLRFLGPTPAWPDGVALSLLLLGSLSAALASLHALHERNLKRLLALTTVAHMGILLALVGLMGLLEGLPGPSLRPHLLSLVAAYALAHGLAKGALFLVAAEVHHATGELDLEALGGLWRRMGRLALVGGLAAVALAGLPPFFGVYTEIGTFANAFAALPRFGAIEGVSVLGSIFLLGVAAAAGLVAVAKLVLGIFLGPPRGSPRSHASAPTSAAPPALLVTVSFALGLAPGLLWQGLPSGADDPWSVATPLGALSAGPLLLAIAGVIALAAFARATAGGTAPRRIAQWNCGAPPPNPRQTYTPQALAMPYRILFAEILRPASDLRLQDAPVAPFAPSKGHYEDPEPKFVEPWLHAPLEKYVAALVERLRRFHRGPVQTYLIVALLVLVLLLFLLPVIP